MSSVRLKLIQQNKFKVCRFCLHANADELSSLYEKDDDDDIVINSTIRGVLNMLGIEVGASDTYPKLFCINCRDTLITIHHFRANSQKSMKLLEKAMAMQQPPPVDVKDENDSDEYVQYDGEPSVNELYEELISEVVIEEQTVLDDDVKPEEKEEIEVATTMLSMSASSPAANDPEPEEESEEAYLMDGFIPIQECEIEIIPKIKPQKAPKKRKPPTYHVCPICGAQTTAMAVHMRIHNNDRPFECDLCDLKFYTSGKLRCHRDSVHIAERKFSCEICGKAFVLKKNLKAHMMSHSNKREHVCSYCSKSFLFRWSLTAHERIHTGERPYPCNWPECGKRFVTVSNLIQHQKTTNHSKEAAVEICSLCNKAFQTQAALKAHRTKTHGTDIFLENVTMQ